jgi:small basic protein
MWYSLFGLILGIFFASQLPVSLPVEYAHYTAVVILGLFDAIFGALRADLVDHTFNPPVFFSGLVFNALLALCITHLGELLGLNLYLAATVVFTFRIFQNVGVVRRVLLDSWISGYEKKTLAKKALKK